MAAQTVALSFGRALMNLAKTARSFSYLQTVAEGSDYPAGQSSDRVPKIFYKKRKFSLFKFYLLWYLTMVREWIKVL